MKYGQKFERESVPEWSLHNIDYNSLKHYIKVHTTKGEARAVAIPGQPDTHLAKVENELYNELCNQHARAGLFVTAKADEINRRLQHLSDETHRLILRCANTQRENTSRKRHRKFTRLGRQVLDCGEDIQHLERFVGAQTIAFRKLLKKYKKWTGSSTLGARFRDNVLDQPKSFTRKDLQPLQRAYEEVLSTIRDSTPVRSLPQSPTPDHEHITDSESVSPRQSLRRVRINSGPPRTYMFHPPREENIGYWNEYDNGSENGDMEDNYAIYVHPEDETTNADLKAILHAFTRPFSQARSWVTSREPERQSLLGRQRSDSTYGSTGSDEADLGPGYSSSEEFPSGYQTHYASLPSIHDQRMYVYKDRVLFLATSGLFAMAFLLLGIATVLILTGRHKLRVEVDAGATLGAVVSIGCGCTALAIAMTRWDSLSLANRVVISVTFVTVFALNGMLLLLVMGNTAL
ncbi:hypothetical protein M406DRAFT_93571 [Cryphonectria parasitica EP155]|uniref:SPX domain-containing protein n=1 Tax=Cryphonectria parasitica (strain ATCC 38755 / EP155) TaxID=660469 RepID=A0A9P4XU78_CRYP1|nr:uncharacterized protein M406DRAFT_93571 [Cryphonectria parasitica EP155]KAF3760740.1 hypothetical protein M406DRAFT_93571 [Cryphonectria parasitica EP155]